jgi:membrane protease YdiL (CAAX protease family)
MLIGIAGAVTGIVILAFLLPRLRRRRTRPLLLGDIAPLLPRNGPETLWTAVLSINAGVGEELYFRLLLPLLLVSLGSGALAAFIIAGLIFGAMHLYQGAAGIAATTILGGALTAAYLLSGSLWFAVALHAFIDLVGLVIRPSLTRLAASRGAARA